MTRKVLAFGCLLAAAFAAEAGATTVSLTPDGGWNVFDVDDFSATSGGLEWIDFNDGSALSFTFTTATQALMTVVDGGLGGDRYRVFDGGIELGLTNVALNPNSTTHALNFDAALADTNFSRGYFLLEAGTHVITGALFESALNGGQPLNASVGAMSVAPVPLPASLLLLLSGGGLLGAFRRRRALAQAVRS